jgi:NTE family protein
MLSKLRFFILVVCGILINHKTHSQIKNLGFEGAGVRGIAYVGAIKQLEDQRILKNVEKVGGTSAGAIAALTLSLGYNSREIEKIIYDTRLQKFNDGKFFFVGGLARVNKKYGWYRGRAVTKWIGEIIEQKTGYPEITFRELHERGFKDLYVTGTSLNNQTPIVFSHKSYPDMKVKDAVRISISIPLYFEAVCIDGRGKVVDPKKATVPYDIMVDGGFTANFPIQIFDSTSNNIRIVDNTTIGFRIDTPSQIVHDSVSHKLAPYPITRFRNYMGALYTYVIENLNRNTLTSEDWDRTVSISSSTIGPKIRKLSTAEKNMLITNGELAMKNYLMNRHLVAE